VREIIDYSPFIAGQVGCRANGGNYASLYCQEDIPPYIGAGAVDKASRHYKSCSVHDNFVILNLLSRLPHIDDHTVGPDISIEYFSAGKGNDPIHFFRHFFYTEEAELLAGCHVAETCPHVFIPPSAIPTVIYVNSYTFSHIFFCFGWLQVDLRNIFYWQGAASN
jgi:hypothetical protein